MVIYLQKNSFENCYILEVMAFGMLSLFEGQMGQL